MKIKKSHPLRGIVLTVVTATLMLMVLVYGITNLNSRSGTAEIASIEDAARRAAVLCYAVEGRYPSDVEELCENYGLTYDQSRYRVTVDSFASNLLPDIYVMMVGGGKVE